MKWLPWSRRELTISGQRGELLHDFGAVAFVDFLVALQGSRTVEWIHVCAFPQKRHHGIEVFRQIEMPGQFDGDAAQQPIHIRSHRHQVRYLLLILNRECWIDMDFADQPTGNSMLWRCVSDDVPAIVSGIKGVAIPTSRQPVFGKFGVVGWLLCRGFHDTFCSFLLHDKSPFKRCLLWLIPLSI
jgi:hypothetical protein